MKDPLQFFISKRTSSTPYTARVSEKVKAYTVYNHTLLATVFESFEADYVHLCEHVQVWDVSAQKQVQLKGKDAYRLLQMTTPRNLSKAQMGKCYYSPIVDENGGIINDPIILKIDEDCFWLSIADSDILYWYKGLIQGFGLDAQATLLDVSPIAIQGPKSEELTSRVMGLEVKDISFFNYKRMSFRGCDFVVARSGWSKQGGFEIYVEDPKLALPLWDELIFQGSDLNVRIGCPNAIERIESGLLSFGNDMTPQETPLDCGLLKYCDFLDDIVFFGKERMQKQMAEESYKHLLSLELAIDKSKLAPLMVAWIIVDKNDKIVGQVTSCCYVSRKDRVMAIAKLEKNHVNDIENLTVILENSEKSTIVQAVSLA